MHDANELNEAALIRRGRSGDENALGDLVDTHARALIGYLYRMIGDFHQAEDLAQDSFIRAFENLDKFDTKRPFRPWLLKIGRNLALNYLQSRTREERKLPNDFENVREIPSERGPDTALAKSERARGVEKVLNLLPLQFREVLHLRYMEGYEYETIARELDLPLGTVKTRIHRAKRAFFEAACANGLTAMSVE